MSTRPQRPEQGDAGHEQAPVPGLEQLARERLPERDLWSGIEARLPPRRRRQPLWAYGLAASLGVASLVGLILRSPSPVPETTAALNLASAPAAPASTGSGAVWQPPQGELVASLPRQLRSLRTESWEGLPEAGDDPASGLVNVDYRPSGRFAARSYKAGGHHRGLLRANLKMVSQAERELKRALRLDPESESLQDLLAAAEAQRRSLQGLYNSEHD
ncbi:hypothetical protein ED208_05625 [Stagnimonas aquatica]|uniref:Uncharacterized protein n=1 Tax=Stagnimonas aquatica TaxID=2689987 RepID=A0A3N0VGI0_9GAMM|nr:hypothetical protein [Stagnimonas aquatica]ROH91856.1 hypothetical protein ED208_05625 [Stagnimonas aquatica]